MVNATGRAVFGAACAMLIAGQVGAEDACHLTMVASLDFSPTDEYAVTLPVTLDSVPTRMLVDTGGVTTTISSDWAIDQHLRRKKLEGGSYFTDYEGNPLQWFAYIPSVLIGTLHASDVRAVIEPGWLDKTVVGTLGPDFLMHYEVEVDFAAHKFNLFSQDHCPGQVVYWTHDPAAAIPVKIDEAGHVIVDAQLDGHDIKAIVDTGATTSVMKMSGATSLFNLTPSSPGVTKVSENAATGGDYKYTFKSLSLAGMSFNNPAIILAGDANPGNEVMARNLLLGGRQLSKLHIFISYKERMLYVTAAGAH